MMSGLQLGQTDAADQRARELYLRGDALYAEGLYGAAIELFLESYNLSGRPLLLFNLANAYERAGRYGEAAQALRAYEPHAMPDEREAIAGRLTRLEAQALPPTPEVEDVFIALTTFGAGIGAALGLVLLMQGRARDAYPFAIGATVTGAFVGATRLLGKV